MSRRRGLLAGGAVILALGLVLLLSRPTEDRYQRPALDPRGTGPEGTAALVELLRANGAQVRLGGRPDGRDTVVLQLRDTLGGGAATDLEDWVRAGGTLVVADPFAALAPAPSEGRGAPAPRPGRTCEIRSLADLDAVVPPLPTPFLAGPGRTACFGDPDSTDGATSSAGVVARRAGAGTVIGISATTPFENTYLDQGDSAVLAVALLAPDDGTQVRILDPNRFLGDDEVGDGTILGALPTRGRQAVTQIAVAFVVWGLVRGRRLGRPVTEELPVPLPASDLVLASGRLLDRNGDAGDAAERLRRRSRRELGLALGLGPDPVPHELADALVSRAGIDPALVQAALLSPVSDGVALVTTSAHLDRLRQEIHR